MKNRSPKVPTSAGGFSSATVDDVFAAFDSSSATFVNGAPVDVVLLNQIKMLSKKDPQTRVKCLSDLFNDLQSRVDKQDILGLIPLFIDAYTRGALLDPNWKCRSL
jgi:hypothetical protein